jgi:hypothetical protein
VSQQVHDLLSEELQSAGSKQQPSDAVSTDAGAEPVSGTIPGTMPGTMPGTPPPLATFDSWGDDQKRLQEADSSLAVGDAIDDDDDDGSLDDPLSELDEMTLVSVATAAASMCNNRWW